jgi:DNA-binding CsgD family transcriptional regulator
MSSSKFLRITDRLSDFLREEITTGDKDLQKTLQLFHQIEQLFPQWAIMTCPKMNPQVEFQSRNAAAVLGLAQITLQAKTIMHDYYDHIHEADREDLYECYAYILDYMQDLPVENYHQVKTILHYRIRSSDGRSVFLYDEKATVKLSSGTNLYYMLLKNAGAEKVFTGVKVEFYSTEDGLKKISEFKPAANRQALSKRETELVDLIKQGLSTKEIAGFLKISHHTVRNIKSKLFEKYQVNNSVELLNLTA